MNIQTIRTAVLCLAGLVTPAYAAELTLPQDGWASWRVDAVDGAPAWCCWSSRDAAEASPMPCRLDDDHVNFGPRNHAKTDAVRIYARVAGGKVERLRVLSAKCRVKAATPIRVINTTTDDSARWLVTLTERSTDAVGSHDLGESALAALAMHRGDVAHDTLAAIARGDGHVETRKNAVFWLAMLRGAAGADVATSVRFNDKDAGLRKHAAFAIEQSKSLRVASEPIPLGNTDENRVVRVQGWIWFPHAGVPNSVKEIADGLKRESDEYFRE